MLVIDALALAIEQVSVLFSEPKIPQSVIVLAKIGWTFGFSALQRAENSSIRRI